MNKDIQKRIAEVVDQTCGGNKSDFCRKIGRGNSTLKDIIGGKGNAPSFDLIYDILAADWGISPKWLMLGEGEMFETKQDATPSVHIENIQTVNIGNWDAFLTPIKAEIENLRNAIKEKI